MHKNMSFLLIYCWAVFFSITLTCNYYSTCKSKLQQLHNCTHSYHSFWWKMQTQVYIFFSATSTGANNCHTESLIIVLVCLSCMSFDITCTCLYVCVCVIFLFPFSVCFLFICISLQFGGIKVEIKPISPDVLDDDDDDDGDVLKPVIVLSNLQCFKIQTNLL